MKARGLVGVLGLVVVLGVAPWNAASAAPPTGPRSAPTGVTGSFSSLGLGLSGGANVYSLHLRDDSLYVGGLFTSAGGVPAGNVAVWSRSQESWSALGSGASERVFGFASTDDTLFMGGGFCFAGDPSFCGSGAGNVPGTNFMAAWSPSTHTWSALSGGMNGDVLALLTRGASVYAGGQFTTAGGVSAVNIATWSPAQSTWSPLGSGITGSVFALDASDDTVYVGGLFTAAGGVAATNVATWSPSTTAWQPLGQWTGGLVRAIAAHADDTVYAAGDFTSTPTDGFRSIAVWSRSTGSWSSLGTGLMGSGYALQLDEARGLLYAAGAFINAGGATANYVAVWDTGISAWVPLKTSGGTGVTGGRAYALALDDTVLYIGGVFSSASGVAASRVAQWTWAAPTPAASPASGPAGASVQVVGDALVGVTAVRFDGNPVAYARQNATSLSLTVPDGLAPGTYSIEVDAVGGTGSTTYTVPSPNPPPIPVFIAPAAPTAVVATPGNAEVNVTWTPPADTGTFPIDVYMVRTQPGGQTCTTSSTTCTVTGLTNGTAYTFTVTASSAAGSGPASAPSSPVTPRTIPGQPTEVTAEAGDAQATITWSPPTDDGGSPITGYRVATIPTSEGCTVTAATCTITGLTNGQPYVVSVVATNVAGSSAPATATVTPRGKASIVITGSRGRSDPALVKVLGTVSNLDVTTVQPYVRLGRQRTFEPAITQATVGDEGRFTWQRISSKRIAVYVQAGGVTSNRVTIRER